MLCVHYLMVSPVDWATRQTGEIVASIPIRMVNVRNPPRKIAILFMLLSLMLSLRCTGRFGMKHCRE
jgi:hypothetical protein